VLALTLFAVIGVRLVQLQVADAASYAAAGLADRLHRVDLPAPRGTIYDRDGNILVHSVEARYVYADPTLIEDPEATADKVFDVLAPYGVTRSVLVARMTKHKQPNGRDESKFEYLARGIDIADGDRVKALRLPGVDVRRDERREVPGADLAANLLGFIGRGDDHKGLAGLEAGYDQVLRGVDGWRKFEVGERDLDKEIPGGYTQEKAARPGGSIQLTIDRDLQYDVQSTLSTHMRTEQATFACAVVLDVRTGEVVAQASYPGYDAARPFDFTDAQRTDACTEKIVDPGSIHKPIVVGAALQEGVVTPQTNIVVGPSITKGDTTYRDTHPHFKDTPMTIPGVLALSSNVGTIKIADLLGKQRLYDYQRRFGLGEKCGEGLPNEAPGQLLPPDKWTGSSPGSIPIGNGVAVTALQMAAVYAAIANDGVWVQPHLVRATVPAGGRPVVVPAPVTRRVLDSQHAAELRTMLEGVTTLDDATGKLAAIPQYRIAGKTGTAKLPQNGGYAEGTVASFIGMAPADAPRYVVAVVAYTPKGAGGSVAAPAFKDMMAFTLAHFGVLPTGTTPPRLSVYP
jgi:cell division protein FtsI (penicillin-binding protein 3)